jgi:hypothetical protein
VRTVCALVMVSSNAALISYMVTLLSAARSKTGRQ